MIRKPPSPTTPTAPSKRIKLDTIITPVKSSPKPSLLFKRCVTPKRLVGRVAERARITTFLEMHLLDSRPGSLYISGCPGTGKTALVNEIIGAEVYKPYTFISINCMEINPSAIYSRLLKEMDDQSTGSDVRSSLEACIHSKDKMMCCVILDEIDSLISKDQDVLYTLFEWCKSPGSRLVLIGIANALDLTTRFLPRLKTKNFEPSYLSFVPYRVDEIKEIIKDRLARIDPGSPMIGSPTKGSSLTGSPSGKGVHSNLSDSLGSPVKPLMQPMAIELTARKLASTGDVRKALDVCRHAISLVESEPNPQVTIKHILKATASLFGTNSKDRISGLNMQPKLVLTILALVGATISQSILYAKYRACTKKSSGLESLGISEFQDLIMQLEGLALIMVTRKKKEKEIALEVGVSDVFKAVKGVSVLDSLIEKGLNGGNTYY